MDERQRTVAKDAHEWKRPNAKRRNEGREAAWMKAAAWNGGTGVDANLADVGRDTRAGYAKLELKILDLP